MCGIVGEWSLDPGVRPDLNVVRRMADALVHRGPDGDGFAGGPGFGFGHRRLSIVDLAGGAQPMADRDEDPQVVVTFNGEIYNFPELRSELEGRGVRFKTRCDTEVLVHGWLEWGPRLPERLRGMFAFALVDLRTRTLFAARDRLGKKPFYYSLLDGGAPGLAFASEPKALLARGDIDRGLDPEAVAQYFSLRYVPDPRTAFARIRRLPAAGRLLWRVDDGPNSAPTIDRYWQLPPPMTRAVAKTFDERAAGERFLALLDEAVRERLMSDVPLGAFLSGGIDSQMVVDAMTRTGAARPLACTMGFEDPKMDERGIARDAARRSGADLREGVVDVAAMRELDWFDSTFDEPFADGSAIPTYHVSRLARDHVTVALSGDGGDESFAGYRRYRFDVVENRIRSVLPRFAWTGLSRVYPKADRLPRAVRFKRTFENLARTPDLAYARSVSASLPEELSDLLRGDARRAAVEGDPLAPIRTAWLAAPPGHSLDRAVAADLETWLCGDVLTKVDRASMAVSLEVRCPLLDHRIVEWARTDVPADVKLRGGVTKAFLRKTLTGRLGDEALRRPKQGFHVPLRQWFEGDLGDELLSRMREGDSFAGGFVDLQQLGDRLQEHRSGARDHGEILWASLCFDRFVRSWA